MRGWPAVPEALVPYLARVGPWEPGDVEATIDRLPASYGED